MIITIYAYDNKQKKIKLPNKEISQIYVAIISGDETGSVDFSDGTRVSFDASQTRLFAFFDASYIVEGEDIKKWIDFNPSGRITASYERLNAFREESEGDK